jgi:hypothetical protein
VRGADRSRIEPRGRLGASRSKTRRVFSLILCTVSILLACLGGYGWITPIEPEDLRQEAKIRGEGELLTLDAFYRVITPTAEPDANYARRLARAVNGRLVRAWDDDDVDRLNLTIPFTHNYLLWSVARLYSATYPKDGPRPDLYRKYEFTDPHRAVRRGVGQCSQHALVVAGLLAERRIRSRLIGLDGHVVAYAEVAANEWWVIDADHGVVLPFSIERIEADPAIVRGFYEAAIDDPSTVDYIVGVYGPGGNQLFSDACDYFGRRICWIEHASYLGLWLLPAGLLLCAAWLCLEKHSEDSAMAHLTDRVRR